MPPIGFSLQMSLAISFHGNMHYIEDAIDFSLVDLNKTDCFCVGCSFFFKTGYPQPLHQKDAYGSFIKVYSK
jgi:hypothetical protein